MAFCVCVCVCVFTINSSDIDIARLSGMNYDITTVYGIMTSIIIDKVWASERKIFISS